MSVLVYAIYCDDVRFELGGKQSFIGVYNAELLVSEFPTTLNRLFVQLAVRMSKVERPKNLQIGIYAGDDLLAEAKLSDEEISKLVNIENIGPEFNFFTVGAVFAFQNLVFEKPIALRPKAHIADEEYIGNGIQVKASPTVPIVGSTAAN